MCEACQALTTASKETAPHPPLVAEEHRPVGSIGAVLTNETSVAATADISDCMSLEPRLRLGGIGAFGRRPVQARSASGRCSLSGAVQGGLDPPRAARFWILGR